MGTPSRNTPVDLNRLTLLELYQELTRDGLVRRLIELARDEDLGGRGDITSQILIEPHRTAVARLNSRSRGVVAGLAVVPEVLRIFDAKCEFTPVMTDGSLVTPGSSLGTLSGNLRDILAVERTILNILGRLSGIATRSAEFVAAISPGSDPQPDAKVRAKLYDTRKTTPGLRALEKYATRCGGACCHRVGLFDAVLMKDNHIASVSDAELGAHVAAAARKARQKCPGQLRFVEVEVDRFDQLRSILAVQETAPATDRIDIVLLDNMPPSELAHCVALRDRATPAVELEASGGINLDSVRDIARTGVDRISTGSLTHGATWLDIGLDIGLDTGPDIGSVVD